MDVTDDGDRYLEKLVRIAQEQATATGALVEIQRHNEKHLESLREASAQQTTLLDKLCGHMSRMETGRDAAVDELKQDHQETRRALKEHVTEKVSASNRWLHFWSAVMAGLLGLIATLIAWNLAHQH